MSTPDLERGYIEAAGRHVYVCEVSPPGSVAERGVMVILGPFAEEKKSSRRGLHELALACAERGVRSLSVDFTGTGDSPGAHGDLTVESMLEEVAAARSHLRERTGREPALLGLRLGATMASAKEAFESGSSFDLDGFEISAELAKGLESANLACEPLPDAMPAIVIGCGPKGRAPAEVRSLAKILGESGRIEALDIEPFWDRIERIDSSPLQDMICGFLAGLFPGEGGAG